MQQADRPLASGLLLPLSKVCARSLYPSTRAPQPRGWSAKPRVSSRDSLAVEGAEVGRPGRLTLVSSKELVMARLRLAAALIAVLALSACTDSENLTSPTGTLPGGNLPGGQSGGGDTTSTP